MNATDADTLASAIETIAADHPDWQIDRQRTEDGAHGDWTATQGEAHVRAPSPGELLERIEEQELANLRCDYGDRYLIRRTEHHWIATIQVDDGTEPTLVHVSAAALRGELESPPPRIGYRGLL